MKGTMKRIATFALAVMMVLSVVMVQSPIEANAASTKKVTANLNYKKAPALKTGTNRVTGKRKGYKASYVKYKAPKKGTYVFTITGLTGYSNPDQDLANYYPYKYDAKYKHLESLKVKTNKGKTYTLYGATKYSYNNTWKKYGNKASNYLYTRTATVSLKKGETFYIGSFCTTDGKKYSYTVKVKRK